MVGLTAGIIPTVTCEMAVELDKIAQDIVIGHWAGRRLAVHRQIPNELTISLPSQDKMMRLLPRPLKVRKNEFTREISC